MSEPTNIAEAGRHHRRTVSHLTIATPLLWALAIGITAMWVSFSWSSGALDYSLFLESSRRWLHGSDPYGPVVDAERGFNLNPPGLVVALAPLSALPFPASWAMWTLLQLGGLGYSLYASARRAAVAPLLLIFLMMANLAGGMAIHIGQVTFVLLPLVVVAWLAYRQRQERTAGLMIGVLVYVKPFFALYFLLLAVKREWRAFAYASGSVALLWLATLLALPAESLEWVRVSGTVDWQGQYINGSIAGVAARLFSDRTANEGPVFTPWALSRTWEIIAVGALSIVVIAWTWRRVSRGISRDAEWAGVLCSALLLSPLGWSYYFPLAMPAIVAVVPSTLLVWPLLALNTTTGWAVAQTLGPIATLLVGCLLFWVLAFLWFAVLHTQRRSPGKSECHES